MKPFVTTPGAVVRSARRARGWTQAELGRACGYSASSISRMENGRQTLTDIVLLRRIAEALRIPPGHLGLATTSPGISGLPATVRRQPATKEDPVLRRHLLAGAAVGVAIPRSAFREAPTPYASVVPRLEGVLLGNPSMFTAPTAPSTIQKHLTAVKEDYQAARYIRLGRRLPQLLRTAETTATTTKTPQAAALYAEALNVATHTLVKFDVEGLAWVSADRAMAAARAADDPVTAAEATRMLCIVARRGGHHARARQLAVDAAVRLADTGDASPRAISLYGSLLSTAGYTAARAGDAGTAATLLDEADSAAARLGRDGNEHWSTFGPTNVGIYRISAALALDDPAAALVVARTVHAACILTPERRGRFWVDVASAYAQTGRPDASFRASAPPNARRRRRSGHAPRSAPSWATSSKTTVAAPPTSCAPSRTGSARRRRPHTAQRVTRAVGRRHGGLLPEVDALPASPR